jgi:hypothetical protein
VTARWGDFLHTGSVDVKVKGRKIDGNLRGWRDTDPDRPVPAPVAREGQLFVASHVKDNTILGSRPTTPPPTHTEAPSA